MSPVGIGQVVDLEPGDPLLDVGRRSPAGSGTTTSVRRSVGTPSAQLEPGQRPRAEHRGHAAIDQRDREVRGGTQPDDRDQRAGPGPAAAARERQRAAARRGRAPSARPGCRDRRRWPTGDRRAGAGPRSGSRTPSARSKAGRPSGDQVVARGRRRTAATSPASAATARGRRRRRGRHGHGGPGHLELGGPGAAGDLLDRVAVAVARGEVHRREVARRRPARVVDQADALDELAPSRTTRSGACS